jgi:hypothetical protein
VRDDALRTPSIFEGAQHVNLRVIVPIVYAIAIVVGMLINKTVGTTVVIVGALLVALFFVTYGRRVKS